MPITRFRAMRWLLLSSTLAALLIAACGSPAAPTPGAAAKVKVGFVFVGRRDDYGFNYAADLGRIYLEKTLPWVETAYVENVPENEEADQAMERLISAGATIVFPISYGHLERALLVGQRHPEVTFLNLSGPPKVAPNVGTYYGEIWQAYYAAGVAAGKMSRTNKLGFIGAMPIAPVLLSINTFHLGARSVNPDVTTTVVFSGSWCDPEPLRAAANELIDQQIDVLAQHQDCPRPALEVAEERGIWSIGYHADASAFAPRGWITAPIWNWGNLYARLVQQVADGSYKPSVLRAGFKDGVIDLAAFGANVPPDVQELATAAKLAIFDGTLRPLAGPIRDQAGDLRVADGTWLTSEEAERIDWLAEGIITK
jgi:basic membrane protein A and related proteins